MLVIRSQQLPALRLHDEGAFEARLHEAIGARYPDEVGVMGHDGTRALVRHALATGLGCGLDDEDAIMRLAELMVQLGEQFERSPDRKRALARLHHPTLPSSLKIRLVEEALTARTQGRVVVRFGGAKQPE
jgi:hypothetical protein